MGGRKKDQGNQEFPGWLRHGAMVAFTQSLYTVTKTFADDLSSFDQTRGNKKEERQMRG